MSNLLSLDQSSKITGYAVFEDNKLKTFGKFAVEDNNIDTRLVKIRQKIKDLIEQYHIDEVVFEDIQQQNNISNNVQTFKILAEVYGVVSELLEQEKIPHSSILAVTWKSLLGIKGKTRPEQKKMLRIMFFIIMGKNPHRMKVTLFVSALRILNSINVLGNIGLNKKILLS